MTEVLEVFKHSGIANLSWGNLVLILVGLGFVYIAVIKKMEPYVLLSIGLGIVIANLPLTGLNVFDPSGRPQASGLFGVLFNYTLRFWNILPPLIFLGLGALTDFGPIIANPKTLILGAAAQFGIFIAFWLALLTGLFDIREAASIGIIGGADGPTTIFISAHLAPHMLAQTAIIGYSYIASVVILQPPIMRLLVPKKERAIEMRTVRNVSKLEKLLFPILGMIAIILLVPDSAPLVAMFMIGNIYREAGGLVPRLHDASSNAILNVVTIFLMLTVGAQLTAERFFTLRFLTILGLGWVAFAGGTAMGLLFARLMNLFLKEKINPLIGSAGVSAVPMAARLSHIIAQQANPRAFILPHAMGPNVAGVIGSAVVAGVFISRLGGG
ncbi:MAG: sodium ion-translocating decarboxylase subunit beta [Chloroflexi bacterium]|nr:sodium ion-translocating decarboxylase subunit beta [Chloroflexota bacterium]